MAEAQAPESVGARGGLAAHAESDRHSGGDHSDGRYAGGCGRGGGVSCCWALLDANGLREEG